jgi:hypothetical protein
MDKELENNSMCKHTEKHTTPHTCPYRREINDDEKTLCVCCDECEGECADDI